METVYIVLIIAIAMVIITTMIILRDKIKKAKLNISLNERQASAELDTHQDNTVYQAKPIPRSGFVGNIARWWSHIRSPEGARVVNNKATWGSSIEITSHHVKKKKKKKTD